MQSFFAYGFYDSSISGISPLIFQHMLIIGQSLAVGANGFPVVSNSQSYNNLMFSGGVNTYSTPLTSLIPLIETKVVDPTANPVFDGETIASSTCNELSRTKSLNFIASDCGVSAAQYTSLKQGTAPYNLGLSQVSSGIPLIINPNINSGVFGVLVLHGESDYEFDNTGYEANLIQWQSDYQTDLSAITNQTGIIPFFIYQQSNGAPAGGTFPTSNIAQWQASLVRPTKIFIIGPNYPYMKTDGIHNTAKSQRGMGYIFSKAIRQYLQNSTWSPLQPITGILSTNKINMTFNVPVPPLVIDPYSMYNPGNFGFSYFDTDGTTSISGVAITGPSGILITLNQTPTGSNKQIRLGWNATAGGWGPMGNCRTCIRDSDNDINPWGYRPYNWCISSYINL